MPPQVPPADPPEPLKPIPKWTAVVAVAVILAAIFTSYLILSAPIPQDTPHQSVTTQLELARLRAEARRNALATGAGFVAIGALLLALRRQNHAERQQRVHEIATANAEDDALQRRITDARIRAVEQLGSDSPSVRIGGLHNLERIGEQHEHLRQIVLDEICSYLRLPFKPVPQPEAGPTSAEPQQDDAEREVRIIAQEILQRHLRDPEYYEDRFWAHTRLNLQNAHLESIDFGSCRLTSADFTDATFTGNTHFLGVNFDEPARFRRAKFYGFTDFQFVTFQSYAAFEEASFSTDTYFADATFIGTAGFENATFGGDTSFSRATFDRALAIKGVNFEGDTDFEAVVFSRAAHVTEADIHIDMDFPPARFHEKFDGKDTNLIGLIEMQSALMKEDANHILPEGWRLERSPINSGWGRLTNLPEGQAPTE